MSYKYIIFDLHNYQEIYSAMSLLHEALSSMHLQQTRGVSLSNLPTQALHVTGMFCLVSNNCLGDLQTIEETKNINSIVTNLHIFLLCVFKCKPELLMISILEPVGRVSTVRIYER